MTIRLQDEDRSRVVESIRRFFDDELDHEIGDLKAMLVLDYFLQEIAPTVYNQAIADAQAHLADKLTELDGSLYAPEFGYWKR